MKNCDEHSVLTKVRKGNRKQPFDDNKKLMQFAELSSRKSIKNLLDSGISVVYVKRRQYFAEVTPAGTLDIFEKQFNQANPTWFIENLLKVWPKERIRLASL